MKIIPVNNSLISKVKGYTPLLLTHFSSRTVNDIYDVCIFKLNGYESVSKIHLNDFYKYSFFTKLGSITIIKELP